MSPLRAGEASAAKYSFRFRVKMCENASDFDAPMREDHSHRICFEQIINMCYEFVERRSQPFVALCLLDGGSTFCITFTEIHEPHKSWCHEMFISARCKPVSISIFAILIFNYMVEKLWKIN